MRKCVCLIFTLLFMVNLVSCSKDDAYSTYSPPVDGIQWGMSPDEVIKVLNLSEDNILVDKKGLMVIEYNNTLIYGQTANVNMQFDTQVGIGLLGMDIFFPDMDKADLVDELNNAYGEYTAVDHNMDPRQWESEKIKDLSKKMQDRFCYAKVEFPIQVGVYENSSYESIWDMILNQPLVQINIVVNDNINCIRYSAENMASFILFSDDNAYKKFQEYLQDSPNIM